MDARKKRQRVLLNDTPKVVHLSTEYMKLSMCLLEMCDAKYSDKENMHYCPYCGAKMDKEEE